MLRLCPLFAVFLSGCFVPPVAPKTSPGPSARQSPGLPAVAEAAQPVPAAPRVQREAPPRPLPPPQERRRPEVIKTSARGVELTLLVFDDRDFSLSIADKEKGPETEWQSARDAARAVDAVAAINGGFFTPEGGPLGLVVENGQRFGNWNTVSSLTSGLLMVEGGQPRLLRRRGESAPEAARHLLQSGPLLLENARSVQGLSAASERPRSFLAWDGRHHWAIGAADATTLANLSGALASQPVPGVVFTTALNLDGGRSSDLWVSSSLQSGPVSTRRFWNKSVRNYVLLERR